MGGDYLLFSKRHEKYLQNKKLNVSLPKRARNRILMCMEKHNERDYRTEEGFNYTADLLDTDLPPVLKQEYGETELRAYVENKLQAVQRMEDFIRNAYPALVIDAIEAYSGLVRDSEAFRHSINELFSSEELPYRFCEDRIVILDSAYLESEVVSVAQQLLHTHHFEKALVDFKNARENLTSGDYTGTIQECNNAVESAIKYMLKAKSVNQGDLKRNLMKSGILPGYFEGFLDHFEGILQSFFTMANESARHGKKDLPTGRNVVDRPFASLMTHLTATLLVFIVDKYVKSKKTEPPADEMPDFPEVDPS